MSSVGFLCIILGFLLMIFIIANGLLAKGMLMSKKQKINIFLDGYRSMTKEEKVKFINDYSKNEDIKSMCQLFNS
jgi:hypothetical protein